MKYSHLPIVHSRCPFNQCSPYDFIMSISYPHQVGRWYHCIIQHYVSMLATDIYSSLVRSITSFWPSLFLPPAQVWSLNAHLVRIYLQLHFMKSLQNSSSFTPGHMQESRRLSSKVIPLGVLHMVCPRYLGVRLGTRLGTSTSVMQSPTSVSICSTILDESKMKCWVHQNLTEHWMAFLRYEIHEVELTHSVQPMISMEYSQSQPERYICLKGYHLMGTPGWIKICSIWTVDWTLSATWRFQADCIICGSPKYPHLFHTQLVTYCPSTGPWAIIYMMASTKSSPSQYIIGHIQHGPSIWWTSW